MARNGGDRLCCPRLLLAGPGVVSPLASRLFNCLRDDFPQIRINIFEGYSGEIEDWLAEAKIDVGVLNKYRASRDIRFQPLFSTDVLLVCAAKSSYLKDPTIEFKEPANVPLVDTITPHNLTGLLHDLSRQNRIELTVAARSNSPRAIYDLIAQSGLHATLPAHAVAEQLASRKFKASRIVNPPITQRIVLATSTQNPLSMAARQVIKILLDIGRSLPKSR